MVCYRARLSQWGGRGVFYLFRLFLPAFAARRGGAISWVLSPDTQICYPDRGFWFPHPTLDQHSDSAKIFQIVYCDRKLVSNFNIRYVSLFPWQGLKKIVSEHWHVIVKIGTRSVPNTNRSGYRMPKRPESDLIRSATVRNYVHWR